MNKKLEKIRDEKACQHPCHGDGLDLDCLDTFEDGFNTGVKTLERDPTLLNSVKPLIDALEFYADNKTHAVGLGYNKSVHQARFEGASAIFIDSGIRAQEALRIVGEIE